MNNKYDPILLKEIVDEINLKNRNLLLWGHAIKELEHWDGLTLNESTIIHVPKYKIDSNIWHELDYTGYKCYYNIEDFSINIISDFISTDKFNTCSVRTGNMGFLLVKDYFNDIVIESTFDESGDTKLNPYIDKYTLSSYTIIISYNNELYKFIPRNPNIKF